MHVSGTDTRTGDIASNPRGFIAAVIPAGAAPPRSRPKILPAAMISDRLSRAGCGLFRCAAPLVERRGLSSLSAPHESAARGAPRPQRRREPLTRSERSPRSPHQQNFLHLGGSRDVSPSHLLLLSSCSSYLLVLSHR